jgi:hypothetical protein
MERVGRIVTVGGRVGQRAKSPLELQDDPGQPWVMISGIASGRGERRCRKCTLSPLSRARATANAAVGHADHPAR